MPRREPVPDCRELFDGDARECPRPDALWRVGQPPAVPRRRLQLSDDPVRGCQPAGFRDHGLLREPRLSRKCLRDFHVASRVPPARHRSGTGNDSDHMRRSGRTVPPVSSAACTRRSRSAALVVFPRASAWCSKLSKSAPHPRAPLRTVRSAAAVTSVSKGPSLGGSFAIHERAAETSVHF